MTNLRMSLTTVIASLLFSSAAHVASAAAPTTLQNPDQEEWIDLFNGKDLSNWTPKIRGFALGENAFNTFRVEDGILQARYDEYTEFKERFGHIFYNGGPFSHYKIQVEYRFVGEQVKGGPAWALRNNGIMYHTQDPKTMSVEQDFPGSMEYQLLGGNGKDARTTGNLCTPGTHVVFNGKFTEDHIINSSSDTFHGDQWVTAELIVHGSEKAEHFINGKKVLEYTGLQWDDRTPNGSGFIALQAESHPTDFRKVRLLNLEGCMDKKAKNYKSYFVKDNHKACQY
ncbi:MAG TPA: DUF1080 domain-containing protein [Cellvibrio sp.]